MNCCSDRCNGTGKAGILRPCPSFNCESKIGANRARGIADAVGAGIAVEREPGIFLVNFGASTMELSVLSYGGIVLNRLLKIGGMHLDREIISWLKIGTKY